MESKELTAKDIFNRITSGERVYLPTRDPVVIDNLKNHLNVLKSHNKKLFKQLGFEWNNSIIKIEDFDKPEFFSNNSKETLPGVYKDVSKITTISVVLPWSVIYLIAPKANRKYTTFIIGKNEQPDSGGNKV